MLNDLVARLKLDTTDYDKGIAHAKRSNLDFAANLERGLNKKIRRFFGLGVVLESIHLLKKYTADASAEMQNEADATGLAISQLMKLQQMADATGQSWEKFKKTVEESGLTLKQFANINVGKGGNTVADFDASETEKVRANFRKNTGSLKRGGGAFFNAVVSGLSGIFGLDDENQTHEALPLPDSKEELRIKEQQMMMRREAELAALTPRNAIKWHTANMRTQQSSLQAVGAFSNIQDTTIILKEQIQVLKQIDGTLKEIKTESKTEGTYLSP